MTTHNDYTLTPKPEFKPGNSVTLQFGNELLNGKVEWKKTVLEILEHTDYTLETIAKKLEVSVSAVEAVAMHDDTSGLNFKQGARLVGIHERRVVKDRA